MKSVTQNYLLYNVWILDLRLDCLASLFPVPHYQQGRWKLWFLFVLVGQSGWHLCCCQRRGFLMELIKTKNQVIVVSATKNTFEIIFLDILDASYQCGQ